VNRICFHQAGETRQYAKSLGASVIVHGLAVGTVIPLGADLQLVTQRDTFKWDVSMVETPTQQPPETPQPAQPQPVSPEPTKVERPIQKHLFQKQPIRTVQTVQAVQPVQRVVREEVQEVQPVVQATWQIIETTPATDSPIQETIQTIS